jgi:hypothetical protein
MRRIAVAVALIACALAHAASAQGRGADGKFETRTSAHFTLYQDVDIDEAGGFHGSRRFEQEILSELERAFSSLESLLGLRPPRRLSVVIEDPALFDQKFAGLFRFPAAGFYAGVIRVRGDVGLTADLARTLHHELVHAVLDAVAPSLVFPAWINEGLAEWFEWRANGKRGLSSREQAILSHLAQNHMLQPMNVLSLPAFSRLDGRSAAIAYLQSYAMVDFLDRKGGERNLARFVEELIRSRNLDRALNRTYRMDLRDLEEGFLAER